MLLNSNHLRRRGLAVLSALGLALTFGAQARADDSPPDLIAPLNLGGIRVAEVAAGGLHSCARTVRGRVWCWGANENGQLGIGTNINSLVPVLVPDLTNVTQLALGDRSSCALRQSGRVFCWGANESGQLGDGTFDDRFSPVLVSVIGGITAITAGNVHACAVNSDARVLCWGDNAYGQLGTDTVAYQPTPLRVGGPLNSNVVGIGAGAHFTCMLRGGGRIACWGDNTYRQLGDGTDISRDRPAMITTLSSVTQISMGEYHGCARRGNGRLFCWGYNGFGAVGNGTLSGSEDPVRVDGIAQVEQVAAGGYWGHTCIVRANGRIFCWGRNAEGQLGNGTEDTALEPVRIDTLTNMAQVATGRWHSCGVRQSGQAFCWGLNTQGQLGDGTTEPRSLPQRVTN